MTDQQINQRIAEACGIVKKDQYGPLYQTPDGWVVDCPNFTTDLNLMHEAEKVLCANMWYEYALKINEVCWHWALVHAPARQRAEAFLKVLGKWKGSAKLRQTKKTR